MGYLNVGQIARDGVNHNPPELHKKLSSKMCWDAAMYCGYLSNRTGQESGGKNIIDSNAARVTSSSSIPDGDIIGFFENDDLKHVMISTGIGLPQGIKMIAWGLAALLVGKNLRFQWLMDEVSLSRMDNIEQLL